MKAPTYLVAGGLVLLSSMLISAAPGRPARPARPAHEDARCGGEPCLAVARGLVAFFDRSPAGLEGNGRACADCHMAEDQFQLSPADVEERFQRLQRQRRRNPSKASLWEA